MLCRGRPPSPLQRVDGFIDPREGQGHVATYDARSRWMTWPLDQVLYHDGLSLVSVQVLTDLGSNTFRSQLCNQPTSAKPPELRPGDIAEAEQDIDVAPQKADRRLNQGGASIPSCCPLACSVMGRPQVSADASTSTCCARARWKRSRSSGADFFGTRPRYVG